MSSKPRIATFPWSELGRVGIWNNRYDEGGNCDVEAEDQWEVSHGHAFVNSFDTYAKAAAYVRDRLSPCVSI